MKIVDAGDRVHVLTRTLEWTILRGFDGSGRGPCYISDVRQHARPWLQLVSDGGDGHTVNDPRFGGLCSFGLIAAKPGEPPFGEQPTADGFWQRSWEITQRLQADGFGVTRPHVLIVNADRPDPTCVTADCALALDGVEIADMSWLYRFHDNDQVDVTINVRPFPVEDVWWKEPKLVFNGLHGYQTVSVLDDSGKPLGRHDLTHVVNPVLHTLQISDPARRAFVFSAADRPTLRLGIDNTLDQWRAEMEHTPALSPDAIRVDGSFGPAGAYCLTPTGGLKNQTEITRWAKLDVAGLLQHSSEGGYGAPDCWPCFRRPPVSTLTAHVQIQFA